MNYIQTLVHCISSYVKIVSLNFLVAFLTWYALTNGLQVFCRINRFLWNRESDTEREQQLKWLRRKQLLYEWSQQEVERCKEDEICRSASTLRRRIRSCEEREEKLAKRLVQVVELEQLSQEMAKKSKEEEQLRFEQERLSKKIARRREEQEELKHKQERMSQNIEKMAGFNEQSWAEQLREALRKEEEEKLKRNREILARGNERRIAAEEERRKTIAAEYWKEPQFEPNDTEQELELGLDIV